MFGGELNVTEESEGEKSQARQLRDWLHEVHERDLGTLEKVVEALNKMESFCRTKKNMFIPIRGGIGEALHELDYLKACMVRNDCSIEHFEYHLREKMVQRIKKIITPEKDVADDGSQTSQVIEVADCKSPGDCN